MNVAGFDLRLRTPDTKVCVADYRRAARRRVPRFVWAYIDEGADDLETLRDNEAAFDRWSFKPRALTGAGEADLSTTVAGVKLDMPLLLAPTGLAGLMARAVKDPAMSKEIAAAVRRASESLATANVNMTTRQRCTQCRSS